MQNLSKTQLLSLVVGVISAMAGLITTLGQIWGFQEISNQIGETCFAISGFANIVFFGITVQKAKANTVFDDASSSNGRTPDFESDDGGSNPSEAATTEPAKPFVINPKTGKNIDGIMK